MPIKTTEAAPASEKFVYPEIKIRYAEIDGTYSYVPLNYDACAGLVFLKAKDGSINVTTREELNKILFEGSEIDWTQLQSETLGL